MTEDFLYYLWEHKLIEPNQVLTCGNAIEIIKPGRRNQDSGPDFFNARIRLDGTLWAGNVEIHTRSSDWIKHKHHKDAAYESVILHVVWIHDKAICRSNGEEIPVFQIKGSSYDSLYSVYQQLMINRNWIPCAHLIHSAGRLVIHNWLDRMLVERLDRKAEEIRQKLANNKNDWNVTFYQLLAKNFGFHVNAVPFELLARSTPLYILGKHKSSLFQIEALLYGQAGLLKDRFRSVYYQKLKKEYGFLAGKYMLKSMDCYLWRFLRMRPVNFPTIRIAQFASLIHRSTFLFSRMLEAESLITIENLFEVSASDFWNDHYTFSTRSKNKKKVLGIHAVRLLVINTIVPFLYVYGKEKDSVSHRERALSFLEQLPGESNALTRKWESLGLGTRSAYQTQALIELKERYCRRRRCLECGIGNSILKGKTL